MIWIKKCQQDYCLQKTHLFYKQGTWNRYSYGGDLIATTNRRAKTMMEDNNSLSAESADDHKLHAALNTSYSGESEPSTPEREPTATAIRRSAYTSDVDVDNGGDVYTGDITHGVLHAIDSTSERQPMHVWLGDIKLWTMAVDVMRTRSNDSYDTFDFTPFSSAKNWAKMHPELKITGHAIQKSNTSTTKEKQQKQIQPSRDVRDVFDRFFDYFFSGSALSIATKVLLFSGAFYVMLVNFFIIIFLYNNGTLYGLEEGDNMRCVAAFGKEYGQYCTSFVAGLSNVWVLLYASLTDSYGFYDIWQEGMIRRQLDPMKWDSFNYWDVYHYFSCTKLSSSPRPWWSEQQFIGVRDFYHEFAENDDTPFIGFITRSTYQATDEVYDISQNAIPYQTGTVKGRGLKASRDIRQGEMIIKTNNNTVVFHDSHTFRKFLFAMSDRFPDSGAGMVCDILIWAWPQDLDGGVTAAVVDLNNANLLNDWALESDEEDGDDDNGKGDSPNVKCRQLGKTISLECLASKDIMKGEELLANYGDFVSSSSSWEDWLL